jgi:hypothetical protein
MGWAVLYIAFGVVALWLLGEVLLQYKARLRWRLVAFCGFLGVVIGVLLPSVVVIALGTVTFATGQLFVTLSFRRGFSTGWALGGKPGTSRRRRRESGSGGVRPMPPVPDGQPDEAAPATEEFAAYAAADGGYAPDEIPPRPPTAPDAEYRPEQEEYSEHGYDAGTYQDPYTAPEPGEGYTGYPGGYPAETPAWGVPGADYAAPEAHAYPAGPRPDAAQPYADEYAGAQAGYGEDPGTGGWPTAGRPYYQDTPPGGLWMPPQREAGAPDAAYGYPQSEEYPQPPPEGYGPTGQGYHFTDEQRY